LDIACICFRIAACDAILRALTTGGYSSTKTIMEQPVLDRSPTPSESKLSEIFYRFVRKRQNLRVLLYAMLVLCDIVAIRGAFSIGLSIRGPHMLSPHGIDLGWFILPMHIFAGLRGGAYVHDAVVSRMESVGRSWRSFMIATGLICMLLVFQRGAGLISRLAFGTTILMSLIFIAVIRTLFLTVFVGRDKTWMFGELLIVDGAPVPPGYQGQVIDAAAKGIVPDTHDPAQLSTLANLITSYDRVVVYCSGSDRRAEWAQMMKCYHVTGEVVLDDGSPLGAVGVGRFRGYDTVIVARGSMSLGNRFKKRIMDVAVSATVLLFLLPLLILVSILIKLDSRGPVFFAQPRVGRGNQMFRILKFRSMRMETSDFAGSRSATRDDDRVTRVGRLIRATSIDELPQLINVLLGDMSVVGPRPHALGSLAGNKLFWEVDSGYWRRHVLKPGITGLAQVRGFRGATHEQSDLQNRLQSDLEYISGWSLWRDLKILMSTARVIVHPKAF
jgi:lipopolysaccharide/colanic/teichoic acid biosynthesis glycosyltransferase